MTVQVVLTIAEAVRCTNGLTMAALMHSKLERVKVPVSLITKRDRRHQTDKTFLVLESGDLIWRMRGAEVVFTWIP